MKDKNKWIRRFGVVTLRAFATDKKNPIPKRAFQILDLVMKDSERDVKKAVAWILRDMSKKESQKVFEFLMRWATDANKDTQWIIKDGMRKLSKENQEEILSVLK